VLPYTLTLTRQHHLTHLLPHIFSHPIVQAHNRPRARGPPKSTFLFPTPPPPNVPLPMREYHGPLRPIEVTASREDSTDPANPDRPSTPASEKPKKGAKSTRSEVEPPAHEMECIARVTLSIGPISYPGTELWLGRFVELRAPPPKKEKREKVKRQSFAEASAARRARPSTTPQTPSVPSVPSGPAQRVPFGPPPPPRSSAPAPLVTPRSNLVSPLELPQ